MSSDIGALLHQHISGENAQRITGEITKYHRSPGAMGYHAATNFVSNELKRYNVGFDVTEYPLDGETVAGEGPLPMAWEPLFARIETVNPTQDVVVDMRDTSSCLAWWSKPTPKGGVEAELVDVGTGESDSDFDGKDIAGKIVLIGHTERPGGWNYAAKMALDRGAVGLVSDYLFYEFPPHRTREDLPEAVQLLRLPNQLGKYDAWACSISYPAAQRLREQLAVGKVTLHADIRCNLFQGTGQNVLATIEGTDLAEESVFFVAHTSAATCPCANCAAGPALMVEIARTLQHLIDSGQIHRPRRSIKFLYIVEGMGSRWYIHEHEDKLPSVRAAFCFDSVGHDQGKLKSNLLFYRHPDSHPSFINDYFDGVMERAPKDGTWVFANDTSISPVRFEQAPYTPWSDNHTWAAYGVPSPLIMSWPDLYFHTQLLSADKTDPAVFRRTGVTTAVAAWEIADANATDVLTIADDVASRSVFRLQSTATEGIRSANRTQNVGDIDWTIRRINYLAKRDIKALESTLNLISGDTPANVRASLDQHTSSIASAAKSLSEKVGSTKETIRQNGKG